MYDSVQRHISNTTVENCMDELFGCEQWREIRDCYSHQKEQAVIGLYRDQLKKAARFVMPFRVCYPNRNRTIYYLIHLTNNLKGVSIMKSCVAETNDGILSYLGKLKDHANFFETEEFKEEYLKKLLLDSFSNSTITFTYITEQLIDSTPYLEKDIRKTLRDLECNGNAQIERIDSKKTGITGRDKITISG